MNSCLYECHVMHARISPRRHRFLYRIFLFAIDLDELDTLHRRFALFSVNRPNLYSFRERDFLPTSERLHNCRAGSPTPPTSVRKLNEAGSNPSADARRATPPYKGSSLKSRVTAYLAERGVDLTGGRVMLVTLPRVLGYLFNPVSFYFCYDRTGAPVAALAEVTNTFKEMKPYFLGPDTRTASPSTFNLHPSTAQGFALRTPKHFYVSPYTDVDVAFDFALRLPTEKLSVQIDDFIGDERTLTSTLTGPRRALTGARLAWYTIKYPLITLRIISLIHWHAFLLWWKRVPWFAKAARPADQRDLYRPHASIAPESSTVGRALRPTIPSAVGDKTRPTTATPIGSTPDTA